MKEQITLFYEQSRKSLLYFILKNISDKNVAEDLLHEVFIKAYKNVDSLKENEKINSWIYAIAKNVITDYFRKKRAQNIENDDIFISEVEEQSILSELDCCLKSLILKLPQEQKNVINAIYFEEKTLLEYSSTNNLNLSTVKSYSKRAKDNLKKIFNDCCTFSKNSKNEIVDYTYNNSNNKCLCN